MSYKKYEFQPKTGQFWSFLSWFSRIANFEPKMAKTLAWPKMSDLVTLLQYESLSQYFLTCLCKWITNGFFRLDDHGADISISDLSTRVPTTSSMCNRLKLESKPFHSGLFCHFAAHFIGNCILKFGYFCQKIDYFRLKFDYFCLKFDYFRWKFDYFYLKIYRFCLKFDFFSMSREEPK